MRTRIMNDPTGGTPWFEYYQVGGSRPSKQEISELPCVIGRDESADFCVESSRVSRKHVVLDRRDGQFVLRDLDSTNGTYVNGKRITETILADGDVVLLADCELTFFSGQPAERSLATQVMTQPVSESKTGGHDLIMQVRRLHEQLTHRSFTNHFQPIFELATNEVHGYEAIRETGCLSGESRQADALIEGTECRLTERIMQQHRLYAAEQAVLLEDSTNLFFALKVSEVSADFLPESLDRLVDAVAGRHQLVAEIPETAVCDIPYFRQFVADLRQREIRIAYGGFCTGPGQVAEWRTMAPDYLKLAPAMVRGIRRASGGWRMIQSLIDASRDIGCDVVAVGVEHESDLQCLREAGCPYAQGNYLGQPEPITAFARRKSAVVAPAR
ncbi:MAG: EAL domain-containing protein [Pirellulaceae bacterium]|jgi:EAL domain-containing protein (putative c-di-GMP-specific phosphodiesterase class I)|nr:EAL domain-containing protein [Pirellulaceae bacterium]